MEPIPIDGVSSIDMWMLLIIRMITRVVAPLPNEEDTDETAKTDDEDDTALESDSYARQDRLRQTLCDYIMSNFPGRFVQILLQPANHLQDNFLGYGLPQHG